MLVHDTGSCSISWRVPDDVSGSSTDFFSSSATVSYGMGKESKVKELIEAGERLLHKNPGCGCSPDFFIFEKSVYAGCAELAAGWSSGAAAQGGFSQFKRQGKADFVHGIYHFIKWNRMFYASKSNLCTCERIGNTDGISALTR